MTKKLFSVREIVLIALFAAVIAVSAWIAVPAAIPFTMQVFAVFFTAAALGAKCGTAAVIVYIMLGCIGLPVFSGFTGGVGALFSANGGYIIGFIPAAWLCGMLTKRCKRLLCRFFSMVAGLAVCYAFGSIWFAVLQQASIESVLVSCVLPFVVPDIVKIALAAILSKKSGKYICSK